MGAERGARRWATRFAVIAVPLAAALAAWLGLVHDVTGRPKFVDTFQGDHLDADKWSPCFFWRATACTNGPSDRQVYMPSNVRVGDGVLSLVAEQKPGIGYLQDGKKQRFPHTSGMVSSEGKFDFRYGYLEIRARIPKGRGLWPALWMLPADHSWPPEIDLLENVGQTPDRVTFTNHPPDAPNEAITVGGADFSADFHTYALEWLPGRLTFYLDGKEQAVVTKHVPSKRMYLIANLGVGGPWPGDPDATTPFPATFAIDYVKVWPGVTGRPASGALVAKGKS